MNLEDVTFRFLEPEEFNREDLVSVYKSYGNETIPDPNVSNIRVAEKDGKVVGFFAIQPIYIAEPLWVAEEYRGSNLWKNLVDQTFEYITKSGVKAQLFAFGLNKGMTKLIKRCGFKELPYKLLLREF